VLVLNLSGDEWLPSRPGRFTPRERAKAPKEWEAGWAPYSRSRRCGEEKKNSCPYPGYEPRISTVDIPNTPPRLPVVNDRRQDKIYRRHDGLTPSNCLARAVRQLARKRQQLNVSFS
jgi:hypothetical protein